MTDLLQVIYASRSNFPVNKTGGIEPELARILLVSRRNNPRRGLVGALYYGDGCFFQCLEGPQPAVEALLATLMSDARHSDLKVLTRRTVRRRSFSAWSMKYVPLEEPIKRLLRAHQMDRFDPYRFDSTMVESMVQLLQVTADPGPNLADPSIALAQQGYQDQLRRSSRIAWVALGLAIASLVTSGLVLLVA